MIAPRLVVISAVDRRSMARLRHEYAILADLDLPGVIRARALDQREEGGLALSLEQPRGEALEQVLAARRLDLVEALTIAVKLAETIASIHRAGIIHKDICPRNVIWDGASGSLTLMGFGVAARLSQEVESAQHPSEMEGTLAYMSPEQTGRMNRVLDNRTDLYSLGVTIYEMLTGEIPFTATDPMDLVHSHIARVPAPPREKAPAIPEVVSSIVMKLLAKAAEDRYQTARGVAADLAVCLEEISAKGRIDPFPIGRRDVPETLRIPEKLYGREAEIAALMGAFERVSAGATELVLVSGYSGVGKTSLVNEIYKGIARNGGLFASGKFDQQQRDIPYAPVGHALGGIVRHLLAEPAEDLARWRRRILEALGGSGNVIAAIVPEIAGIIGPQPPIEGAGNAEAENRFALAIQRFLRVFTAEGEPLCLFLDDLQWADAASLKLLHLILTDPESARLLVIAAYRANEVDASHPLAAAWAALRAAGAVMQEVMVKPLDEGSVVSLLTDALGATPEAVDALARILIGKTQGNPFFLSQILGSLHAEGIIAFDAEARRFRWDLDRVEGAVVTDNVIDFMREKIARLAPRTRRAVELAACVGYQFDLATLAIIEEAPPAAVAGDLWEALREGVIVPLTAAYRFFHDEAPGAPAYEGEVSYRFLHDGVQQAAYALIADAHRREVHLRIGRIMRDHGGEPLFDVVSHLNLGASLITDAGERIDLAARNLAAGQRAKAGTAFDAAARYFATGAGLLGEPAPSGERALAFALHEGHAQCASLISHFDEARAAIAAAEDLARSPEERADLCIIEMGIHVRLGQFRDTLRCAIRGLAPLGVVIPDGEDERRALLDAERAELDASLGAQPLGDPREVPVLADPGREAALRILMVMGSAAYSAGPVLFSIIALKMVNLSRRVGHAAASSFGYMAYAAMLAGPVGAPRRGVEIGEFALRLSARFSSVELDCKLNMILGSYIAPFAGPLRGALDHLARAREKGLASGDFAYLGYAGMHAVLIRLAIGEDLRELDQEVTRQLAFLRRIKGAVSTMYVTVAKQVIANLTGRTADRFMLTGDGVDEQELIGAIERGRLEAPACYFYTSKLEILFLHEDFAGALVMAFEAEKKVEGAWGLHFITTLSLFACLTVLARWEDRSAFEEALLDRHQAKIAGWVDGYPEGYAHAHLLVLAERARVRGDVEAAMDLYDRAADAARAERLFHREALIHELAARFFLGKSRIKIARAYMTLAYAGYLRWGATAKAQDLAARHPDLVTDVVPAEAARSPRTSLIPPDNASQWLDVTAVIRAAEAIASEIVLDKVLDRVMRIVVSSAGAQRGALLLDRDGDLFVDATFEVNADEVRIGPSTPARESNDLPQAILDHVARTGDPVVSDGAGDARFTGDDYLDRVRPRSVLCLAMTHRGRRAGILYLENGAAEGAFPQGRIELLRLLASQAAIAVDNALLVTRITEANAAAARAAQREHLIEAQRARLAELAAPLIPITDRVMVMPLIGMIDEERAGQILEAALSGAASHRAAVVILDVTGVKQVDGGFAGTLMRAARALALLGTEAVITGIHGEMARAMVALGLDLGGIVARGTLESGIAYALARAGGEAKKRAPAPRSVGRPR